MAALKLLLPLLASSVMSASGARTYWNTTEYLFAFGDSYTTDGYNISAGVSSPVPDYTSSNGQNWVQYLSGTYNITQNFKAFDLGSGGATIDAALVPPYLPTVLSIVDQVSQFDEYLASHPAGANWNSSNSLFAFWIGINDLGNSIGWTNITSEPAFYSTLMDRYFGQVENIYQKGGRKFLFLTVPPTNRAPLWIEQGTEWTTKMADAIADYNGQLASRVKSFQANHTDLTQVVLFNTGNVFNTLLDNAETFGYVNITGYCEAYANGIAGTTTQVAPCAPLANYFWLNTLHPLYTVHNILAHAMSTALSSQTN